MKRFTTLVIIVSVLSITLLSCGIFSGLQTAVSTSPNPTPLQETDSSPVWVPPEVDLVNLEGTLIDIYEKVNPGVVSIRVITEEGSGQGSGFVIDKEGHIITNYHVIENYTDLEVAFPSGIKVFGEVLGTDLDSDLAVIKVDVPQEKLHPLTLSDSEQVNVGQTVIAIGNPFGFRGTMTMGIVSGLGRTMQSLHEAPGGGIFSAGDIIQTDAAINPGNSGGPLLNLNGDVIGVNRAIYTNNFTVEGDPVNSGIGFAISVNIARLVAPSLISKGTYDYPYVGITSVDDLSLFEIEELDLHQSSGVYITDVTPDSPADKAGLRGGTHQSEIPGMPIGGDLIIAIDGIDVQTFSDFISHLIKNKTPGDTVTLTILRNEQEIEIELTLGKRPSP